MTRGWIACFVLMLAWGCQPTTGPAGPASSGGGNGTYRIAVIPKGTTHEFWKSVHAGAVRAAEELGDVEIYWKGPILENDREGQINVVQDFTTKQVDGICLAPLDSQALIAAVSDAKREGIPTVIFDSALADESIIVSYVATDNYHGGALAARELAKQLGGQGDVILLRYNPGSESTEQREQGFLDTLAKEDPEIHVLSSEEYAGTTPESSLDKAQQMLGKYTDEVDGVFSVCEPNAAGMLGALVETGLAGKVKFVGFDPNPRMVEALREGQMDGIVLQDPVQMGYLAVKTMVAHLRGEEVERRVPTGEYVATRGNMDEPEMDKLLHPVQYEE